MVPSLALTCLLLAPGAEPPDDVARNVRAAEALERAYLEPSDKVLDFEMYLPREGGGFAPDLPVQIDFDTGRTFTPKQLDGDELAFQASDAVLSGPSPTFGIRGLGLGVRPIENALWDNPVPRPLLADLWRQSPVYGYGAVMDAHGELPRTFLFRTRHGGGGILQITERIEADGDRPAGLRGRYRLELRGEGDSLVKQVTPFEPPVWYDARFEGQALAFVRLGQIARQYEIDHGDLPASLDALREAAGDDWPADLPATLTYVPRDFDAFPRRGPTAIFFGATELPPAVGDDKPGVVVGFDDGSSRIINDADELADLLARARAAVKP